MQFLSYLGEIKFSQVVNKFFFTEIHTSALLKKPLFVNLNQMYKPSKTRIDSVKQVEGMSNTHKLYIYIYMSQVQLCPSCLTLDNYPHSCVILFLAWSTELAWTRTASIKIFKRHIIIIIKKGKEELPLLSKRKLTFTI